MNTIFLQQERFLWNTNRPVHLLAAFRLDLKAFIAQTLRDGFKIILLIDANKNMRDRKLQRVFLERGLIETTRLFLME